MSKFKVKEYWGSGYYYIGDDSENYMHRDGEIILKAREYWPTQERAQAVLDKFQPPHVWKHGDVFKRKSGVVFIYLVIYGTGPVVYLLGYSGPDKGILDVCLADATFLFNIKEKIDGTTSKETTSTAGEETPGVSDGQGEDDSVQ